MIKARPDAFAAYVAAGQVTNATGERERFFYDRNLRLAKAAGDRHLWPEWRRFDFRSLEGRIPVPVVMITGEDNDIDPTPLAKAWLDRIEAPSKVFAPIAVPDNHAMETHALEFLDRLNRYVRPLTPTD